MSKKLFTRGWRPTKGTHRWGTCGASWAAVSAVGAAGRPSGSWSKSASRRPWLSPRRRSPRRLGVRSRSRLRLRPRLLLRVLDLERCRSRCRPRLRSPPRLSDLERRRFRCRLRLRSPPRLSDLERRRSHSRLRPRLLRLADLERRRRACGGEPGVAARPVDDRLRLELRPLLAPETEDPRSVPVPQ